MCMESKTRNCNGSLKNVASKTHAGAATRTVSRRTSMGGNASTFGQPKVRISFSSRNR